MTNTVQVVPPAIAVQELPVGRLGVVVGLLFGLAGMGSAATAIALPDLARDLGVSTATSAWVISAYALTLAVATAVHGRIADLVGIRRPLMVGVCLMAGGAAFASAAPSFPLLVVARLLQGAGAAAVPVLGTALIASRSRGAPRAVALAHVAGVASAVSALGPLFGGALAELLGWRAVVALPTLGLLLLPTLLCSAPTAGSGQRLDLRGAGLTAVAATGLVLLVQSPSAGPAVGAVGLALIVVAVPLAARHVRRRPDGFLPAAVLRNGDVVRASLAASALPAAWFALLVAVPTVLAARGWSLLHVGLSLVPSAVTGLLASRWSGRLLAALGARTTLGIAAGLAAVALMTAALGAHLGGAALLVLGVVLVTVAFGLGQPALSAAVDSAVDAAVRGVALGVATLLFLTGGAVGSAVVGGLGDVVGLAWALLVLVLLPVAGAAAALLPGRTVRPTG